MKKPPMTMQISAQRCMGHFPAALHAVVDVGGRARIFEERKYSSGLRAWGKKKKKKASSRSLPPLDPQSISGSARAFDRGCGRPAECTLKMI